MKRYYCASDIEYILTTFKDARLHDNEVVDEIRFNSKEAAYQYIRDYNIKHWELVSQYYDVECGWVADLEDSSK